jgi:hypothetical protein
MVKKKREKKKDFQKKKKKKGSGTAANLEMAIQLYNLKVKLKK